MAYIRLSTLKVGDKFKYLGRDKKDTYTYLGAGDVLRFKIVSSTGLESEIHGDIRVNRA